ncbi:MAG: DUF3073 domain-containing protein [Actinomycetota bacterium]|nr:DUF3073 domain-containing protein [Actinomycetota bacterium]MDH4352365.1 DUF3073 domain-containing protein [Actinomycetota bacterium]
MGRGRAKAKQTKVARELKYASGDLDINALTAELAGSEGQPSADADEVGEDDSGWSDADYARR